MESWRLEQLETEAAARITWGDSRADVRKWLLSHEIDEFYVDAILRDCLQQRATHMRLLGMRNLLLGSCSMAGALAVGIGGWMLLEWLDKQGYRLPALYGVLFVPATLLLGYATWQSWLAIDRLIFGAGADGEVK